MCQADPTLKESWGCLQPVENPIWELEGDLFFSCPLLWITEDTAMWYREYEYAKEFGGVPFDRQTQAWVNAYGWYTSTYSNYKAEEQQRHQDALKGASSLKRSGLREVDDG